MHSTPRLHQYVVSIGNSADARRQPLRPDGAGALPLPIGTLARHLRRYLSRQAAQGSGVTRPGRDGPASGDEAQGQATQVAGTHPGVLSSRISVV